VFSEKRAETAVIDSLQTPTQAGLTPLKVSKTVKTENNHSEEQNPVKTGRRKPE